MVMLQCRKCGGEVSSDERSKKCKNCGELFPFECAVCARHLRPPVPDFPVERYFTEDNEPLCSDHYQRQCPECNKWFRADENPGYFMCLDCTKKRDAAVRNTARSAPASDDYEEEDDEPAPRSKSGGGGCGASMLMALFIGSGLFYFAQKVVFAAVAQWPIP
jgi:predicted RNA-binding Zn-ribbon protein involved in translation (DUF1610 family)